MSKSTKRTISWFILLNLLQVQVYSFNSNCYVQIDVKFQHNKRSITQRHHGKVQNNEVGILNCLQIYYSNKNHVPIQAFATSSSLAATSSLSANDKNKININSEKNGNKINWTKPTMAIAIPALIGAMTDPLLSLIDTAFVGQLPNSSIPLAALGACTSIFHLAFSAFRATTTATTSLVSETINKERDIAGTDGTLVNESANQGLGQDSTREVTIASIQFGLIVGFSLLAILLTCAPTILSLMGISSTASSVGKIKLFQEAESYLKIRTLAAPFVLFCTVTEGIFRGYANTFIPLIASIVAATVNLVLDPILMFGGKIGVGSPNSQIGGFFTKWGKGLGVSGAAGATAFSQLCAGCVYAYMLWKKRMIPSLLRTGKTRKPFSASQMNPKARVKGKRRTIWKSILKANLTMLLKQGSLLLAWAYATSRATKIGTAHVAAHQVALSLWLVFALIQDGAAVAAQVLMSKIFFSSSPKTKKPLSNSETTFIQEIKDEKLIRPKFKFNPRQISLIKYMFKLSLVQSSIAAMILHLLGRNAPSIFTNDIVVQGHLKKLMPILALQQPLISITLVSEGLAVGGNQFGILALGTLLSTVLAMKVLFGAKSIEAIWKGGIVCLFLGRFLTALVGISVILTKGRTFSTSSNSFGNVNGSMEAPVSTATTNSTNSKNPMGTTNIDDVEC